MKEDLPLCFLTVLFPVKDKEGKSNLLLSNEYLTSIEFQGVQIVLIVMQLERIPYALESTLILTLYFVKRGLHT